MDRTYANQFSPDYRPPDEVLAWIASQKDWVDSSWGDDTSPSFNVELPEIGEQLRVVLWVDHQDPDLRELPGKRYHIVIYPSGCGAPDTTSVFETDDVKEAIETAEWTLRLIRTRFGDLKEMWDTNELPHCVTNYGDVHNFCDANMLGDVEELMEASRQLYPVGDGSEDWSEKAQDWQIAVLNGVDSILDAWLKQNAVKSIDRSLPMVKFVRLVSTNDPAVATLVVERFIGMNHEERRQFMTALDDGGWGYSRLNALVEAAMRLSGQKALRSLSKAPSGVIADGAEEIDHLIKRAPWGALTNEDETNINECLSVLGQVVKAMKEGEQTR